MVQLFVALVMVLAICSISEASGNYGVMTKAIIDGWSDELYIYKKSNGEFPNIEDGLLLLCDKRKYDCSEIPKDSWRNELKYIYPSKYGTKEFDLYSLGKNGVDDFGERDDISNWSDLSIFYYYPMRWIAVLIILVVILTALIFLLIYRKRKGGQFGGVVE